MGMFDYIKYKAPCWKCGKELTNFQSKDGDCVMDTIQPSVVNRFYDSCNCGAWNEYKVIKKEVEIVLDEVESKQRTY